MRPRTKVIAAALVVTTLGLTATAAAGKPSAVEFKRAQLRVEINSTDGDAGLQIDLDHDPWKSIRLTAPDGRVLLDVRNRGDLRDYGLTELFSESSEPAFTTFPLADFKRLFPEGEYVLEGRMVDGTPMRSVVTLTHDFPAGPVITSPGDRSTLGRSDLRVSWRPVTRPAWIQVVRYQVLVVNELDPALTFSAHVPASVHSMKIPAAFLTRPGAYKAEVLAIEASGNQTLTEVAFTIE
jgi:hypothetical protein